MNYMTSDVSNCSVEEGNAVLRKELWRRLRLERDTTGAKILDDQTLKIL